MTNCKCTNLILDFKGQGPFSSLYKILWFTGQNYLSTTNNLEILQNIGINLLEDQEHTLLMFGYKGVHFIIGCKISGLKCVCTMKG